MTHQRLTPQEEQELRQRWDASLPQTLPYPTPTAIARQAQEDVPKLLAEIDRLRGERQWQPIETAPKNGTEVLLYSRVGHVIGKFCRWAPDDRDWMGSDWVVTWDDSCLSTPPTHWMPLPAAPDAAVPPRPQEAKPFTEAEVAELMYRMRAEPKLPDESIPEMVVRILGDHIVRQQGESK